jgi:F-type H+-transporting ATPase subunit delta
MEGARASIRYAKAILAFAQENNSTEAVAKDMEKMNRIIHQNDALQIALENPLIDIEKKLSILNVLFSEASEASKKLFSLLADNKRLGVLAETGKKFLELYSHDKGVVKATITSAVPLTKELEKTALEKAKKHSKRKINIENKIDPSIIGGFILKIGDMQLDASVVNQLKSIKSKLTNTNTI